MADDLRIPQPLQQVALPMHVDDDRALRRVVRALDIAVLDECPLVVHGVGAILGPVVRRVRSVTSDATDDGPPADLTLWDPAPGSCVRTDSLPRLLADSRHRRIVVHSFRPPHGLISEILERRCAGYVDKRASAEDFVDAIRRIAVGERQPPARVPPGAARLLSLAKTLPGKRHGLSRREAEVISLIARGLTNDDISLRVGVAPSTVKSYIRSAYRKLGVSRRSQAVRWGVEHGFDVPSPHVRDGAEWLTAARHITA